MSYTPPAGNAAALTFTAGYTPPAGNAATLSFVVDPIATIQGSSSFSAVGRSVATSSFSIAGTASLSVTARNMAQSSSNIAGVAALAFVHANPNLNIVGSTTVGMVGVALSPASVAIAGQASTNFERYYPPPMQGAATVAFAGGGIVSTKFTSRAAGATSFKGIYEVPTRFRMFGKTRMGVEGNTLAQSVASIQGCAEPSFFMPAIRESVAGISGAGSFAPKAGAILSASFSGIGQAGVSGAGQTLGAGSYSIYGPALAGFVGDFSSIVLTPPNVEADVIYVTRKVRQEFVRGV